ncbi:MAG TPA: hypothetical protein VMV17_13575 [Streptosporangiaceae bacterium]|nr:hypothetical protein [Streptosporangiaceae bacterium]
MIAIPSRWLYAAAACVAAVAAGALAAAGQAAAAPASLPRPAAARQPLVQPPRATSATTITIDPTAPGLGRVASRYVGFSYSSSDINSGHFAPAGNYPALLANFGPGVMRFGGNSVDLSSYTGISASALAGLAKLAAKTGWKVIYTVNLGAFNATEVTADASHVAAGLGASLAGISCGNEPDRYRSRLRSSTYTEQDYLTTDLPKCLAAVHAGAPGAPIAGPDTYHTSWLPPYATAAHAGQVPDLAFLAEHLYPMTNCGSATPGGAATLLSAATMSAEDSVLAATSSAAATAGVPWLIAETNSASCSGIPGVSNTYASALWAADWLMRGAEHGARGMYVNGSLNHHCGGYTPLCEVSSNQYLAEPVYYGMLFAHLMGTGVTLPAQVTTTASGSITAHAVRTTTGRIKVMAENLTASPTSVVLQVAGVSGAASTLRLRDTNGNSLSATSGVRIQGASVTSAGTFTPGAPGHLACKAGKCTLTLPAHSGLILALPGTF